MEWLRIVLASRPVGLPSAENFEIQSVRERELAENEVLLRTIWLSVDPYVRGRMSDSAPSYSAPLSIGETIDGATISEVVQSRNPRFSFGDKVLNFGGWQTYSISNGKGLRVITDTKYPLSTRLGVLGITGLTAYAGVLKVAKPSAGQTFVVAAAMGPVGSVAGQIAKILGARTVGIAGGEKKCRHVKDNFKFDDCIDHRSEAFLEDLATACPDGIDVYFENVGGKVLEAVVPLLNNFSRISVCGLVSQYNGIEPGSDKLPGLLRDVLTKRISLQGFVVSDFSSSYREFIEAMSGWLDSGKIYYCEDVVDGLRNAPLALTRVLQGQNFGKQLVRIGNE